MIYSTESAATQAKVAPYIKTLFIAVIGSAFLALMSQIAVYLPYTSVPQTMQTLGVFLLAGIFGAKRAGAAVIAYLAEGASGLPVFAAGTSNPLWFCGPNAGFLISFVIAAYIVGALVERKEAPGFFYLLISFAIGQCIIWFLGWSWLSLFIGTRAAFFAGITPFIIGAFIKSISGACIVKGYNTLIYEKE